MILSIKEQQSLRRAYREMGKKDERKEKYEKLFETRCVLMENI